MTTPPALDSFIRRTLDLLRGDPRFLGLLAAGSAISGSADEFSDLDLVLVCTDDAYPEIMAARREFAASLGPLLSAFTGEHVGEPRLLICLYDAPLLHVDLKFITLDGLDQRVETPVLLHDADGSVTRRLAAGTARWPERPDAWFEERAWIWLHYAAAKIARGELFEALGMFAFFRDQVLGPLLARAEGRSQRGVRRLEQLSPAQSARLRETVAAHDAADCWRALQACMALYTELRPDAATVPHSPAEPAVRAYIARYSAAASHRAASRDDIVTIRPASTTMTKQGLPNFFGVSEASAGSTGLAMNLVVIPPGARANAHYHAGFETAIHLLKGRVKTLYGRGLRQEVIHEAGDFIFIPPDVPHQPINLSDTEEALALIARNDPNEQESVVLYNPAADSISTASP